MRFLIPAHSTFANHTRLVFYFCLGGAVGTLLRWWLGEFLPHDPWPWNTFAVNVLGSLLIGVILEAGIKVHAHIRAFHAVGFCGGLTTYSAFAVETVKMFQQGAALLAAAYVLCSVLGCILAAYLGFRLTGLWPPGRQRRPS